MQDASADSLFKSRHNLLFGVRRSIRYHHRRRLFFDRIHKLSTILSALSGSATIAAVLANAGPVITIVFAALVAVSSITDLVVGTAQAARLHDDLTRRFIDLEKSIINSKDLTEEVISSLTARRLDIEADEPPPLKVLDSVCHNELLRAMGYDKDSEVEIKWYQRLTKQFFDLKEHQIS